MSNEWSKRGKRWQAAQLSGLKTLCSPQILTQSHKPLVPLPLPTRKPKSGVESERRAQQRLVQWMYEAKVPFYAICNGADVSPHHRQTLLSEGMSPGMFDLCLPLARGCYHSMYLELKRSDGGSGMSDAQKAWQKVLQENGHFAVCCHGYEKAKEAVEWYLSLDDFGVRLNAVLKGMITSFLNIWLTTKKENAESVTTRLWS
jgi:hypothetical protein